MSLPTDNPEPSKRVSITKAQLHEGAASELLALLEEITADGKVSSDEAKALSAWLSASEATGIPGIVYLRGILEHVLSDGILSTDEHKAVYDAIEKVLPIELRREARERRKLALATEKMRLTSLKEAQRAEAERQRPFLDLDLMVAGSSHGNRQRVIREEVQINQQIMLHREPDNPYDRNAPTMTMKGGNTEELYAGEGRLQMAESLRDQHPDVTKIVKKFGRFQHHVDYRPFAKNELKLKECVKVEKGTDDYGMNLFVDQPPFRLRIGKLSLAS